jgi:signal peptidase
MPTTESATDPAETSTGPLWWARQIISWVLLLAMVIVLAAVVVVPRVSGAVPYTILTGSMQPDYPPGTLIVVRKVPISDLALGTVITYQLDSGEPEVVTHRIVGSVTTGRGEQRFITQGDANGAPDTNDVRAEQIRGELWYSIPYLGRVNSVITGTQHIVAILIVAGALFAYAGYMVVSSFRDGRREAPTS